ncbi:DUF2384 domain-containing protein [Halomonas kenyensis]|uniref:DUF2384 domain-containing protein n=1 Tax=Billgrantia kenyensis TaxID=321266 RepID=A0A7V9VYK4_9GAMM|nr:DUF2384 domain-containing protein [Halomonas kenyensis]MCG6661243.1 DUF2384 domain-containing protein [Halomonas kenyensis]
MRGCQCLKPLIQRSTMRSLSGGRLSGCLRGIAQRRIAVVGLGGKRPVDVMRADPQQVLDLIGRIEHGVHT